MSRIRRMRPLLGTFVEIGVEGSDSRTEHAVTAAYAAIEHVQARLSFHDAQSDLSRLNRAAGQAVTLHPLSLGVLRLARRMTEASSGAFNCTVGGELVSRGILPDHGFGRYRVCGDASDIVIENGNARLQRPVLITLDGIAKGYAVDCAIRTLRRWGMVAGWVNAGGDLRCFGDLAVPVQRREADGSYRMLGGVRNAALASSHTSLHKDETFPGFVVGAESAAAEVWSVMATTAWRADALTKVAACTEPARRAQAVRRLGGRWIAGDRV